MIDVAIVSEIYRHCYSASDSEVEKFIAAWSKRITSDGFKISLARDNKDRIVGYGYGWSLNPKNHMHLQISALLKNLNSEWMTDCFYLSDLAVLPSYQRKGFSKTMLDDLFLDLPHSRSLLLAETGVNVASSMYSKLGWHLIADGYDNGTGHLYQLMGKNLKSQA